MLEDKTQQSTVWAYKNAAAQRQMIFIWSKHNFDIRIGNGSSEPETSCQGWLHLLWIAPLDDPLLLSFCLPAPTHVEKPHHPDRTGNEVSVKKREEDPSLKLACP